MQEQVKNTTLDARRPAAPKVLLLAITYYYYVLVLHFTVYILPASASRSVTVCRCVDLDPSVDRGVCSRFLLARGRATRATRTTQLRLHARTQLAQLHLKLLTNLQESWPRNALLDIPNSERRKKKCSSIYMLGTYAL